MLEKYFKVNYNLLYLEMLLFTLDDFSFDSDIIKLINDLKELVDNKIYSNEIPDNCDVSDTNFYIKLDLKKVD